MIDKIRDFKFTKNESGITITQNALFNALDAIETSQSNMEKQFSLIQKRCDSLEDFHNTLGEELHKIQNLRKQGLSDEDIKNHPSLKVVKMIPADKGISEFVNLLQLNIVVCTRFTWASNDFMSKITTVLNNYKAAV